MVIWVGKIMKVLIQRTIPNQNDRKNEEKQERTDVELRHIYIYRYLYKNLELRVVLGNFQTHY